jgi:uncharacterized protein
MKTIQWLTALMLSVSLAAANGQAVDSAAQQTKRQQIIKLLETTQALALSQQMASAVVSQLTGGIRSKRPDIPQTALDFLPTTVAEVMRDNEPALRDLFIALYDKHFTLEDIVAVNAFYDSAAGKKMIEKTPVLMQQGMTVGVEFGRRIGPEIDRRVREKLSAQGYKL